MTPYRDEGPALPAKLASLRARLAEVDAEIESTELLLEAWASSGPAPNPWIPWLQRAAQLALVAVLGLGLLAMHELGELWDGLSCCPHSGEETTFTRAQTIRSAHTLYRSMGNGGCPTPSDLIDEGFIQDGTEPTDAWGNPFFIVCEGDGVRVVSDRFDGEGVLEERP